MSYTYDSSTGNIIDEVDDQIIATTADRSTTDQGTLLAASKDLLNALKIVLASGINPSSEDIASQAIKKATDAVTVVTGGKHFQHSYRVIFRTKHSIETHSSIEFKANHHDHAKIIMKENYPDSVILNIVRL